jgi:hypothetical protein
MKRLLLLPFLLMNLSIQAQVNEIPKIDKESFSQRIYNEYKSTFEKPQYHYITLPFRPENYFHPFNLSDEKRNALLDTLKSNTVLKMIRTDNGKRLRLSATFPPMGPKDFSCIEEAKLSILETHIFSSANKEAEFNGVRNYESNHIDTKKLKERIVTLQQTLNKEMALVDTNLNTDNLHGKVRYKLSFVTGYDSLRLDRSSISKTFRFGDADIKVIDIIENKVILQVISSKMALTSQHLSLLNFDSIGNLRRDDYRYYNQASRNNAQTRSSGNTLREPLFVGMYSMQQSVYEIFKQNPEISNENYKKVLASKPKEKNRIMYFVYCSFAPLTNSFMLYKPVLGNEQTLEVELSK